MKCLHRLGIFVLAVFMTACALSPQTVVIRPEIDLPNANAIGNGATVSLEVIDNRPSRVIGTRGGVYADTSEINTVEDIRKPIRTELTKALQKLGYQVVPPGQTADSQLKILIDSINYESKKGGNVSKAIMTAATIRAVCKVNGQEYTGRYRSTRTSEVLAAPKEEENEEMINASFSHVLERVLTDQQLLEFMRG